MTTHRLRYASAGIELAGELGDAAASARRVPLCYLELIAGWIGAQATEQQGTSVRH